MRNDQQRRAPLRRSGLRLAVAGTLAAIALAGCEAGIVQDPDGQPTGPAPTTQEPARTGSPEPSDAPEQTEDPQPEDPTAHDEPTDGSTEESEDGTDDEVAGDDTAGDDTAGDDTAGDDPDGSAADPGEVPPPGAQFEVGDTVTTHVQALKPGDDYYGYATLATTVTSVEKGDPDLFAEAENAEDLAGYTPWFVSVEHEWLTYEGEPNSNMIPRLGAENGSGGELSPVINATWSAGVPGCTIEMPDEKGVGEKATNCHVFAVPDGQSVGAVVWNGDDYADGDGNAMDNPYWDEPVRWLVP